MDFKKLLENKTILYSAIGGAIALVLIIIMLIIFVPKSGSGSAEVVDKIEKENFEIVTTDNTGKAIEIQSLLARSGINAKRKTDGSKTTVFLEGKKYTNSQRDNALLTLVKSGLIDQNTGLEIFDKNDFTSTKDDKRIKLARAVNGELARLIRKLPDIENASVMVSIPENTFFKADKKPISAAVMLTVPSGKKLDASSIKTIKSLLLGSVSDLSAENISITDSNGNVYSSLVKASDDQISQIEEHDNYIQNKISKQLDMLLGRGNYAVTVSTQLNQVPKEITSIAYDSENTVPVTIQEFKEGLGSSASDTSKGSGAVSIDVPESLQQNQNSSSSQNQNYERTAVEKKMGAGKTHITQYVKAGIIEKISIAVTLSADAMPANMSIDDLKLQIAKAASPDTDLTDVSIAFAEAAESYLSPERSVSLPVESSGNPWFLTAAILIIGLIIGLVFVHRKLKLDALEQEQELKRLQAKTAEQEKQLNDVNLKAAELIEKQSMLAQEFLESRKQLQIEKKNEPDTSLDDVIGEISDELSSADREQALDGLKSWIEKS